MQSFLLCPQLVYLSLHPPMQSDEYQHYRGAMIAFRRHCLERFRRLGARERRREAMAYLQAARHSADPTVLWDATGRVRAVSLRGSQEDDQYLGYLTEVPELEELCIDDHDATSEGLAVRSRLKGLRRLTVRGGGFTSLAFLRPLTELRRLDLGFDSRPLAEEEAAHLESLPGLEALGLNEVVMPDAVLPRLAGLSHLKT